MNKLERANDWLTLTNRRGLSLPKADDEALESGESDARLLSRLVRKFESAGGRRRVEEWLARDETEESRERDLAPNISARSVKEYMALTLVE